MTALIARNRPSSRLGSRLTRAEGEWVERQLQLWEQGDGFRSPTAARQELAREFRQLVRSRVVSHNKWHFLMISPQQDEAVIFWLRRNSRQPLVAIQTWAVCKSNLEPETGEVRMTRQGIARRVEAPPGEISRVMSELVRIGALIRERDPGSDLRRPGNRYFVNSYVATHLSGVTRDDKQREEAPMLKLVEGTVHASQRAPDDDGVAG